VCRKLNWLQTWLELTTLGLLYWNLPHILSPHFIFVSRPLTSPDSCLFVCRKLNWLQTRLLTSSAHFEPTLQLFLASADLSQFLPPALCVQSSRLLVCSIGVSRRLQAHALACACRPLFVSLCVQEAELAADPAAPDEREKAKGGGGSPRAAQAEGVHPVRVCGGVRGRVSLPAGPHSVREVLCVSQELPVQGRRLQVY
jgi:hypothetical protein